MNVDSIAYISGMAPLAGYGFHMIRKSLDAGEETKASEEALLERMAEERRRKVQEAYRTGSKPVRRDEGQLVNIMA